MGPGGPAQEALLVGVHQAQDFSVVFAISLALSSTFCAAAGYYKIALGEPGPPGGPSGPPGPP
ncbi:hypothetical protein JHK85_008656 [Glycine max]|nr:hypothetical protein JHK85_008656 [Glycine max]